MFCQPCVPRGLELFTLFIWSFGELGSHAVETPTYAMLPTSFFAFGADTFEWSTYGKALRESIMLVVDNKQTLNDAVRASDVNHESRHGYQLEEGSR